MTHRIVPFWVAIAIGAAPAQGLADNIDPEKFVPIEVICGSGDDVTMTKANAAGRSVRFVRKDGMLLLSARNQETEWRFGDELRTRIDRIDDVADPKDRKVFKNALAQLDTLTAKICKGSEEYRRQYEGVLRDFRRRVGVSVLPK